MMSANQFTVQGLTGAEVTASREKYGRNSLLLKKDSGWVAALKSLAKEPMVLLLLAAAALYWISGHTSDAIFLAVSIFLVAGISLYQDSRSRNALEQLKQYSQPACKVIRNGEAVTIPGEELVMGDAMIVEEGGLIMADGMIIHSNDFAVNESILTGESLPVHKNSTSNDNHVYHGTTVVSGLAVATVTAIGNATRLGMIGKSLEAVEEEKTPLEMQISSFVRKMVIVGVIFFAVVWGINFYRSHLVADSLMKALTLAMSILPEEIPVAFTTFMALGAWRLMKMGIVVKQMKTVETLGSASVICADKTGTLTQNKMSLAKLYTPENQRLVSAEEPLDPPAAALVTLAMWASEPIPFDPMELALHAAYTAVAAKDERPFYRLIHEYPLGGKPPMMTHIFEAKDGSRIIAAKGAPEALMAVAALSTAERETVAQVVHTLTSEGYRVLGVGEADFTGNHFPPTQQEFAFTLKGLVAFYDPPKPHIKELLETFYRAGITVKIITGDNAATAAAIARQIHFKGVEACMEGNDFMRLPDNEVPQKVAEIQIFARMFPEAKLKVINALKANHEIVAMTGDGVNDGPALKAAHIGIAMGRNGSEIAKQAASLILQEDDLSKMADAVAMGRRIYSNLKKAIQYIISIHIPIILTVFIPLAAAWRYPAIFSPVHIIFLELIMGPTCSVIYENEPIEQNLMQQKPRPLTSTFFSRKELATSMLQGLVITAGTLSMYGYAVQHGYNEALTRTLVFTCLIAANIALTLVNRSFYYPLWVTLRYKNNLVPFITAATLLLLACMLYLPPLTRLFAFETPAPAQLCISAGIGLASVIWFELVKWYKRAGANGN